MATHTGDTTLPADTGSGIADLLPYLADNKVGIFVIFAILFAVAFLVQWLSWVFGWGRFKPDTSQASPDSQSRSTIRLIIADLFVKVIDDFRHLLALLIVVLFAFALIYVLIVSQYGDATKIDNINKAMQAVTGTLGGIIGVILGYYFGESAGRANRGEPIKPGDAVEPEQGDGANGDGKEVVQAPAPPAAD